MIDLDEEGLKAARRLAGWEIGDASWANRILNAYFNPEPTNRVLDEENAPERTGVYRSW